MGRDDRQTVRSAGHDGDRRRHGRSEQPNTVYAATGDISFGSFAFGSAGILKSTDAGATWTTLGADVFAPRLPRRGRRHLPAVPGGHEGSRRSEQQQEGRRRHEDRPLLLLQRRRQLDRPLPDQQLHRPAAGHHRPDPARRRIDDDGLRGHRRARLRDHRAAEPRPERRERRLQAGRAAGAAAARRRELDRADDRLAGGHGGRHARATRRSATTRPCCAANANKLGRIEMAIAPSNPQVLYAEVQAVDPHTRCGALQVTRRDHRPRLLLRRSCARRTAARRGRRPPTTRARPNALAGRRPVRRGHAAEVVRPGLAVDPNNPNALFLDMIDIWKSKDGGATMTDISCGYYVGLNPISAPIHVDNHVLAYAPRLVDERCSPGTTAASTSRTTRRTCRSATPTTIANPPTFTRPQQDAEHDRVLRRRHQRQLRHLREPVHRRRRAGQRLVLLPVRAGATCPPAGCQWSQRIGGDGFFARIEPKQGQRVFMESQNGALQRSTTGPGGPVPGGGRPLGRRHARRSSSRTRSTSSPARRRPATT